MNSAPIARLKFVVDAGAAKDPLFGAIVKSRRSSKVPYEQQRPLDSDGLAALADVDVADASSQATSDAALVADVRSLTWRAWMIEASTPRTWMESVDLMRIGRAEIEANPDGIALGGAVLEALAMAGQVTRAKLADPKSSSYKMGADKYSDDVRAGPRRISGYPRWQTRAQTRSQQAGRMSV